MIVHTVDRDSIDIDGRFYAPFYVDSGALASGSTNSDWQEVVDSLAASITKVDVLPSPVHGRASLWSQLDQLFDEYGNEAWGEGRILPSTLRVTKHLVGALPFWVPNPDMSVDPDGEIALSWFLAPYESFSVSISPKGRLTFAGLFGESRVRGVEEMARFTTIVADYLARLFAAGRIE
jgi:hypothetical protein